MGRKRKSDKHLPQRVYLVHGTYYYRPKGAKPLNLGRDFAAALAKYGTLMAGKWSGRTMGDIIDRYRIEVLPLKRSASTRRDQGRQLDRLKFAFGDMLPDSITAQGCYAYQDSRRSDDGKLVPVAARHEVALLGHVFAKAIRWGKASANPARGLDLGPRKGKRAQVLMSQVEAVKKLTNERMRRAIDLAVAIGQRKADLLKIKREHLTAEGIYVEQGKGGARVLIEWTPDLERVVAELKAMAPQIPGEYLIRTRRGKPYSKSGFYQIWRRAMLKHVKAGGVPFTFHDLRSVAADGKATAEEARDLLGHASVETTKRHYLRGVTRAKPRS
jgi:integrase